MQTKKCKYCNSSIKDEGIDNPVWVDDTGGDVCGWNGGNEPHEPYGFNYDLESRMRIAQDTKKHFVYNKFISKWQWCDKDESDNLDAYQGPYDTFEEALQDSTEPYMKDEDN
jgi:hypothetical protein